MLEWVAEQKSGQLLSLQHPSDLYEELAGIYMRAHPVSLQDEIRWITERLRVERARLSAFCLATSKHSGVKTPRIDVKAVCDAKSSTLTIEVISDSRPSNREANEKSMAAIRKLIRSGSLGPRTRTEGGSGFLKLAAVVGQSERGDVTFGYAEDGRFRLKVTYALIIIQELITDAQ